MISVRCLGHIATSVGARELELSEDRLTASELVDKVRGLSSEEEPGFNSYNTLVLVDDGEAAVPAGGSMVVVKGQRVTLIPVSHGG